VEGVEFTPDGKGLVTGSWDKTLKYWDVSYLPARFRPEESARIRREIRQNGGKLGKAKVVSFEGHTVRSRLSCSRLFVNSSFFKNYISDVSISPDGEWVASGSWDDTVRIWNLHNAKMECILRGHKDVVWSVDFSPVGGRLATGGGDYQLILWDYGNA
jgi:glucose repression regulatory protein TUP1